ncbi:MAG TPA: R2-like ligand-binding oxidase [Acidimicrobiales bacterium]|nr:R2-like ligand-binding oxidase [Acidimicrobiales bacterium]
MTDTVAASGKIQETQMHRYRSTRGINHDSVAWKLWEKSKKLFWDPADIDWSQDTTDWAGMTQEERLPFALSARGFMVGEEAVTLDIVPLLRAMSDLGRLEDTLYLSMFVMEEAKHTDMFRRWFDAIGYDPSELDDIVRAQADASQAPNARRGGVFDGELTRVMQRLDTDRSPEAILDATLVYNQLVEGVAAINGYHRWNLLFRATEKMPGLEAGLKLTRRDEARHISYGTYLGRRIIAENPELWDFVERRWAELTEGYGQAYGGPAQAQVPGYDVEFRDGLIKRRLAALAVARNMSPQDVDRARVDDFVPEELASVD